MVPVSVKQHEMLAAALRQPVVDPSGQAWLRTISHNNPASLQCKPRERPHTKRSNGESTPRSTAATIELSSITKQGKQCVHNKRDLKRTDAAESNSGRTTNSALAGDEAMATCEICRTTPLRPMHKWIQSSHLHPDYVQQQHSRLARPKRADTGESNLPARLPEETRNSALVPDSVMRIMVPTMRKKKQSTNPAPKSRKERQWRIRCGNISLAAKVKEQQRAEAAWDQERLRKIRLLRKLHTPEIRRRCASDRPRWCPVTAWLRVCEPDLCGLQCMGISPPEFY